MKLYHGSRNKELKKFDFEYDSSSTFDFGKGIYFTSNFERAKAWSCHENGEGAVYEIDIDFTSADLNKKIFSKDEDDIYYVLYICRLGMSELAPEFVDDFEKYDVVVGPVLRGKKNASMDRYKDTDTENHWKECSCGQVIEKDEHKYGEWTVTKDATATEKGSKEKLCSVCGNKIIEEIPVLVVDNNDNSANNPQTGDDTLIILAIVLWVFVSCGVIIVSRFNKNRVK